MRFLTSTRLQLSLEDRANFLAFHQTQVGRFRFVVDALDLAADALLIGQFHDRFEKVDVEAQYRVNAIQLVDLFLCVMPSVANESPDHRPILLFDAWGVVLFACPTPREGEVLRRAVAIQLRIDKLAATIRMNP